MAVVHLSTATRNAMCNAAVQAVDQGSAAGTVKLYTATQPASANTAVSSQTLLATFTLDDPSFGSSSSGVATLGGTPRTTTGVAAGTATWFRCESNGGSTLTIFDGTVTATGGGGALELNTTTISNGVSVSITSGTFTMPSGE